MGYVERIDVLKAFEDQNLMGGAVDKVLNDQEFVKSLAKDISSDFFSMLKEEDKFKDIIVNAILQKPALKEKILMQFIGNGYSSTIERM